MITPLSINLLPWEPPTSESPSHGLAAPTPIPSQLPSVAPHARREEVLERGLHRRRSSGSNSQLPRLQRLSLFPFALLFQTEFLVHGRRRSGNTTSGLVNGFDDVRSISCLVAVDAGVFDGQHVVPLARCLRPLSRHLKTSPRNRAPLVLSQTFPCHRHHHLPLFVEAFRCCSQRAFLPDKIRLTAIRSK